MAREVFATNWIKLEVIGEEDTLQPDVFGLIEASRTLIKDGFYVLPYTTDDLVVAENALLHAQLAKVLDEVEGEGVVVVDHQQHLRSNPLISLDVPRSILIRYPL